MADEIIEIGSTRYLYHRVSDKTASIAATTIDTTATNGGTLVVPVADARAMWAGLRAAERYQRLARTKSDAPVSSENSGD